MSNPFFETNKQPYSLEEPSAAPVKLVPLTRGGQFLIDPTSLTEQRTPQGGLLIGAVFAAQNIGRGQRQTAEEIGKTAAAKVNGECGDGSLLSWPKHWSADEQTLHGGIEHLLATEAKKRLGEEFAFQGLTKPISGDNVAKMSLEIIPPEGKQLPPDFSYRDHFLRDAVVLAQHIEDSGSPRRWYHSQEIG